VRSWNVNGLRAAARKGFLDWLKGSRADVVGLQEVRAREEQLEESVSRPRGWHTHIVPAAKLGYSGVGMYSRSPADRVETSLGEARFDDEGRVQLARFGRLFIANVYFPNGNGRDRDNSRVPYKLDFYRALFDLVQRKRRGGYRVLVMGDFNTAHREIDLARPKQNRTTSGFLAEEREELDRWIRAGWIDTYRAFDDAPGRYSWWSQRGTAREQNVGWRLDYVLASPSTRPFLRGANIDAQVMGSDHCPVGVDLDPAVLG
jgi:exodeoxyribonuclease-3